MKTVRITLTLIASLYALGLIAYLSLRIALGDTIWWLALLNNFAPFFFLPLVGLLGLAMLLRMRRGMLLLPLALVGVVWFGPYYLPKSAPAPTGPTLRVLTFNVWGNNHDLSRVEAWIREINPDLVLLQEVSPTYAQDALPNLFDLYPYQVAEADEKRWNGNIILSRYPIIAREYLGQEDAPTHQRLVVDMAGQPVSVYNVHLAFPARWPRLPVGNFYLRTALGYDTRLRDRQIADLLQIVEAEPYPLVVAGDFNTSDQSVMYTSLAARMNDSFREAGVGLGGSWPVSQARGLTGFLPPLIRIDYIWHSDHFRALEAEQGPPLGSDHLALTAILELLPEGRSIERPYDQ